MVEWLGLHAFTAKGPGLISGQGTKIPKATQVQLKKRKNKPPRVKRKVTKWEKISAMHIPTKNLYPEYTNILQINKKVRYPKFLNIQTALSRDLPKGDFR